MRVETHVCSNELEAWDTLWRWMWFTRPRWESNYWKEVRNSIIPLISLFRKHRIKTILDCSCGLGYKTILIAKEGYEIEGSDGSKVAIKYARMLAREKGVKIKFFVSKYGELKEKCIKKYDCVISDNIDESPTKQELTLAFRNVYSVLKDGGKFIIPSVPPSLKKKELRKVIEKEWKGREKLGVPYLPYKKNGVEVIHIEFNEKVKDGILENNLFVIRKMSLLRVEVAPIMNPRIKWTYREYRRLLRKVGFENIYYASSGFIVAEKVGD